jgi:hypothetical protein
MRLNLLSEQVGADAQARRRLGRTERSPGNGWPQLLHAATPRTRMRSRLGLQRPNSGCRQSLSPGGSGSPSGSSADAPILATTQRREPRRLALPAGRAARPRWRGMTVLTL